MYKVLKCVVDENRRGTRSETGVTLGGGVVDPVAKKAVCEKLTPALTEIEGLEMFDKETGKIKIRTKPPPKEKKEATASDKMIADFRALIKKPGPKY